MLARVGLEMAWVEAARHAREEVVDGRAARRAVRSALDEVLRNIADVVVVVVAHDSITGGEMGPIESPSRVVGLGSW